MDREEAHTTYLKELARYPVLTADEEREALGKARAGDRAIYRRVVWSYLRRAYDLAQEFKPEPMHPLDAAQEANVILIRLVQDESVDDIEAALREGVRTGFETLP